ncbi:MAG: S41 family peptidase, partial [Ignavibacteriales bacterium]|nr:S41 family peptidase [Ignavibacteriales bacterium]
VSEIFLPKNSLIVSTKGKGETPILQREYRSVKDAVLPAIPLAVLVNRNSASASEIVAGAIQDYDRGILLGTRTYGKGLVQTIVPLPYNSQLKVTTAKYYTPSGRSIQEIDYSREKKSGTFSATPESLRKDFSTTHNRRVKDLGGISPDTVVELTEASSLFKALMQKSFLFKYANAFLAANKEMPLELPGENAMISDFKKFVSERAFTFEDETEQKLRELNDLAKKSQMSESLLAKLEEAKAQLEKEKDSLFERNKKEIVRTLRMEIMSRYRGEKGRIEVSLKDDEQVNVAIGVLKNKERYDSLLTPHIQEAKVNDEKKKE